MKCNYCGKEFEIGNRPDGLPNGFSFFTELKCGEVITNICADCIIETGKEIIDKRFLGGKIKNEQS